MAIVETKAIAYGESNCSALHVPVGLKSRLGSCKPDKSDFQFDPARGNQYSSKIRLVGSFIVAWIVIA